MTRLLLLAACMVVVGCGDGDRTSARPDPAPTDPAPRRPAHRIATKPRWPRAARCVPDAQNCTAARGTVVYVERVDPDGDGDAHLVLASAQAVTGPGITAIDIEKYLRPHPLPRIGDRVSAAGPVYRGSYGQRQIQATELHVRRR